MVSMTERLISFKILPLIETEAVFTKAKMNNEWLINFVQNCPFGWDWSCIYQDKNKQ